MNKLKSVGVIDTDRGYLRLYMYYLYYLLMYRVTRGFQSVHTAHRVRVLH